MSAIDQTPLVRSSVRAYPNGDLESNKPSVGRKMWYGVTKFVSVLGTATRPFAEGWRLAGGPGGDGAVVLANFLERTGAPGIRQIGQKIRFARAQASAESQMQVVDNLRTNTISTEVTNEVGNYLSARHDAISSNITSGL